jgi:hypothetical protein
MDIMTSTDIKDPSFRAPGMLPEEKSLGIIPSLLASVAEAQKPVERFYAPQPPPKPPEQPTPAGEGPKQMAAREQIEPIYKESEQAKSKPEAPAGERKAAIVAPSAKAAEPTKREETAIASTELQPKPQERREPEREEERRPAEEAQRPMETAKFTVPQKNSQEAVNNYALEKFYPVFKELSEKDKTKVRIALKISPENDLIAVPKESLKPGRTLSLNKEDYDATLSAELPVSLATKLNIPKPREEEEKGPVSSEDLAAKKARESAKERAGTKVAEGEPKKPKKG